MYGNSDFNGQLAHAQAASAAAQHKQFFTQVQSSSGLVGGQASDKPTVEHALDEIGKLVGEIRDMSLAIADKIGAPNSPVTCKTDEPMGMTVIDRLRAFRAVLLQARIHMNGALSTLG